VTRTPDQVCGEARDTKFTVKVLPEDKSIFLIEGNRAAFHFLSDLFAAHAEFEKDCGFQFAPAGSGSALFTKESTYGLYLHRLPCLEDKKSE
jgi:hypothetical protein